VLLRHVWDPICDPVQKEREESDEFEDGELPDTKSVQTRIRYYSC